MCSYIVEKTTLSGSAKGPNGWMRIDTANVYFDHPYHAPFSHALAIDFVCEADGAPERVAVELSADSARAGEEHPGGARKRRSRPRSVRTASIKCDDALILPDR